MSASISASRVATEIDLTIGGFVPLSTCDWPGELAATVFCRGCPWACRYCHNTHLIAPGTTSEPSWREVAEFLSGRRGLLDGVVFSGGEPTLQRQLPEAIAAVREAGFRVGLHTAGAYPRRLAAILPLLDWVGFDVKAPFADYERITGVAGSGGPARASLALLVASGVAYEVRTTVHPVLLGPDDLVRLADELAVAGVRTHRLQPFRSLGCADPALVAAAGSGTGGVIGA